jgi:hypothetical protein
VKLFPSWRLIFSVAFGDEAQDNLNQVGLKNDQTKKKSLLL